MTLSQAIQAVIENQNLSREDMAAVMRQIMTGEATPAQIGGFLIGLRMKGETVDEITAAAEVMRDLATPVAVDGEKLVDIVGTGGDGSGTFNISTACTFVVAAAGGRVAKHGNRSVSSKSGSADLLEAAGVNLELTPEQVATCVREVGVGFMFAPLHHSAMKHAIGPRKEMAVRTVFNVLGPLTNPAGASSILMGVFDSHLVEPLANVLQALGSERAMVVSAADGMDEISISTETCCSELRDGKIRSFRMNPDDFGIAAREDLSAIQVSGPEESLAMIRAVFAGEQGAARDVVKLNAGAAIYVAGLSDSIAQGIEKAEQVIDDGSAAARLEALAAVSQGLAG